MLTIQQINDAPILDGNIVLACLLNKKYPKCNTFKLMRRINEIYILNVKEYIRINKINKEDFDSFYYYSPKYKFLTVDGRDLLVILTPFGSYTVLDIIHD